MTIEVENLFARRASSRGVEEIFPLMEAGGFQLEQIVSQGQATPADQWYDQERPEWVMLVRGTATLRFEAGQVLPLQPGDYLTIPAHAKHRVDACSADALWLALHYRA